MELRYQFPYLFKSARQIARERLFASVAVVLRSAAAEAVLLRSPIGKFVVAGFSPRLEFGRFCHAGGVKGQ
jgi:hypothetical protein